MKMKKNALNRAIGLALAGMAFNAAAETTVGVTDLSYDKNFGAYYTSVNSYSGATYNYVLGVNRSVAGSTTSTAYGDIYEVSATATDGFGEAGDYWTVNGTDHTFDDPMIAGHTFQGLGQLSWCQAGTCSGAPGTSAGWNHTSQHVLFSVTTAADISITLANSYAVEGVEAGNELEDVNGLGNDLIPGFTLYSGVSQSGWNPESHTFTNESDFTLNPKSVNTKSGTVVQVPSNTDLTYMTHDANAANANSITQTYSLTEGLYSLWFGGNIANIANTNSTLACDTTGSDGNCTGFGGHGKNFQLTIETAPVPLPGAVWLFGGAIAGLGALGRRKKANVA